MAFFNQIQDLLKAGIRLTIQAKSVGDLLQLDIIPAIEAGASGVAIPPCSFTGTSDELDTAVPEFLQEYSSRVLGLKQQMTSVMAAIDQAGADAVSAAKSKEEKRVVATPAGSKKSKATPAERANAGFLDGDNDAPSLGPDDEEDNGIVNLGTEPVPKVTSASQAEAGSFASLTLF